MIAIISLLVVLILSMIVVRVASVGLRLTGISQELARFQARSAFTGAGFTTSESEKVVHHPVRRRIIMLLMLSGNAGIITVISSLVLSLVSTDPAQGFTGTLWFRMVMLVAGLSILWTIANSSWIDDKMSRIIAWALARWTDVEIRDYAGLLHLSKGYLVSEFAVQEDDWLAGRALAELELADEGILVLGIEKSDGTYFGAPRGPTKVESGDVLFLYGRHEQLASLDQRRADATGNREHRQAVREQHRIEEDELKTQQRREAHSTSD